MSFTVTFSVPVTGVETTLFLLSTDFALATSGLASATITSVTGSGTTYTVVVNAVAGSSRGTVGLNLADNDSIVDAFDNPLDGRNPNGVPNGNVTGPVYAIVVPTVIGKAFSPNGVPLNGNSTLTFTITNPNNVAVPNTTLHGVQFTDTLPANVSVAANPNVSGSCGPAVDQYDVIDNFVDRRHAQRVTGRRQYMHLLCSRGRNDCRSWQQFRGRDGKRADREHRDRAVIVVAPPGIQKSFAPTSVALNGTNTVTFLISNPNAAASLSGIAFNDPLSGPGRRRSSMCTTSRPVRRRTDRSGSRSPSARDTPCRSSSRRDCAPLSRSAPAPGP